MGLMSLRWWHYLSTIGSKQPTPAGDPETQDAGQFWKEFIRDTAQESGAVNEQYEQSHSVVVA
jgi:hypothetical protein